MSNNILHVINSSGLGGAETIVKEIIRKTKQPVFCLKKDKIERFLEVSDKVYFGTNSSFYKFNPFIFFKLYKLIKEKNINILHVHLGNSLFYAILIKHLNKHIKIIDHEHGEIFRNNRLRFLLRRFGYKIDLSLAISKATKNELMKKVNISENKIKVLYNFVNLNQFNKKKITWNTKKEREKLKIKEGDFVIGFAGRFIERKGWKEFILAANLVLNNNKNIKFLIAGDGKDKNELLNLIKSNKFKKNIIYSGFISNMVWFYSLLDCFVIPSHWEPMGLVEVEAQAMGIPVIASNVPALDEIIQDRKNGLLFEAKNSKDLAGKIKILYKNSKLRNQLIMNSLKSVNKYSSKEYLFNLNKIYNNLGVNKNE
jgi:L-malate glycosyltransferase